ATSGYPISITHTNLESAAWWQVDLDGGFDVASIIVHNRPHPAGTRLEGAVVEALDAAGNVLWSDTITGATTEVCIPLSRPQRQTASHSLQVWPVAPAEARSMREFSMAEITST
ncbi:MAG: hypothetical protein ABGZ35_21465, partial [Planctomycetaceae bacterium]